jgi:hypothetical protein
MPVPIAESATTYVYQQALTTSKVLFFAYTWHMRFCYAMIQDRRTCLWIQYMILLHQTYSNPGNGKPIGKWRTNLVVLTFLNLWERKIISFELQLRFEESELFLQWSQSCNLQDE